MSNGTVVWNCTMTHLALVDAQHPLEGHATLIEGGENGFSSEALTRELSGVV